MAFALTACGGRSGSPLPTAPIGAGETQTTLTLAHDAGTADYGQVINVTVYLKLRNAEGFAKRVDALYQPGSSTFRHWLTDADLKRYAAPRSQMIAVRNALVKSGLAVLSTDADGFSIRARGTIGRIARAFGTEVHEFTRDGVRFRAPLTTPRLSGSAGAFVDTVAGLESHDARPCLVRARNPQTLQPYAPISVADVDAQGGLRSVITDQSLSPSVTEKFAAPHTKYPKATYSGIVYAANPKLTPDFGAKELQKIYGLTGGPDGAGQTIVLLEAYDYPQMEADANIAARLNGLPQLTSDNLVTVYPEGKPNPTLGVLTGWNTEIAIDVQAAHAIAPGAKIVVVSTVGEDSEDMQYSMQYILDHKLGYAVSDSWAVDADFEASPQELKSYENILIRAAAKGVSFQFSTGDGGDNGLGTPVGAPAVPADSPHATAVGGTAILNDVGGTGFTPVSWGDAITMLYSPQNGPIDPLASHFVGGGGGGESIYWPKPAWQSALPGPGRHTPDVSALADPYTGFPVVQSDVTYGPKTQLETGWGGTSLASPIFTAIWAIAQQKAGHPLGFAAPTLARMKSGLTDVKPLANANGLSGSITDKNGTALYARKASEVACEDPSRQGSHRSRYGRVRPR
ncbi:MAG TPA: S53 family peptidase [Candidatus Acidoferrales bacterium]|nr:S53 family peptidase [Candidatus Acidoferrales bacterium]